LILFININSILKPLCLDTFIFRQYFLVL
jgi:hypothetical protein